jgi:transcriptional regulator of acetoin/glycerol metabolism/tetratricopeptide (TPR) repeat protein
MAGLLHGSGPRHAGPFVDVNCAAIPETLLESELFGFERGAFTDARAAKRGLLEAAHRGTLFLDEIGALPDVLQTKLLTAIESRQIRRLGSTRNESVDVWIIAATSEDLTTAMKTGRFRRELYHRLSTVILQLPPLRARGEDILILADHFLARAAADHGIPPKRLAEDARDALLAHVWPGNVRELGNVLERVMLLEDGPVITAAMLALPSPTIDVLREPIPPSPLSPETLRADERQQLVAALTAARGNISRAAARLGIPRNTLRYRLAKHELYPHEAAPNDGPDDQATENAAPAKAIRWEERSVAVLGAAIAASSEGGSFEPAAVMPELIEKLTSFGARIEQFTPSELVAVFGIDPTEDAARRAVLAAHAMLQALRRFEGDRHGRFAVHVGSYLIARSGAITGMDAHARRQASDIASALIQQAGPDQVVVDAAAARFLERHFTMEAIGSGPGAPARIVGRERPRFEVGGRTLSRFVGRARDLDTLLERLARAEAGAAQIVCLVGEPGVGKSRLVFELTHSQRVRDCLVLHAGAESHGKATSYLPVADLLRGYFRIGERDTQRDGREKVTGKVLALDRALEPTLPALLALLELPVEDARWQGLDPSRRRQRTLDAVKRLLLRESQVQPLLVIFEDLHWIDTETQACLDRLVDNPGTAPLLLLVTYRPEYRDAWMGKTNHSRLRLAPLAPESADEMLDTLLGHDASLDPLKRLIAATTGRNPLFMEESVRTLVETRVLDGERGAHRLTRSVDAIQVPATVQAILAARIDRLPAEERRVLETAAVIGRAVSFTLLETVADERGLQLQRRLGHLRAAELLYETRSLPDPEYTFKHALTHEVAYGSVQPDRRRALHARIVEAMEALYASRLDEQIERLAYHALQGEVREKAVHYLRQAGLKAAARSALSDARAWFEQALGVLVALPENPSTLEQAFEIRLELQRVLAQLGEVRRAVKLLREAEALAESLNDERRRGRVCAVLINRHSLLGEFDEALVRGARALEIARRLGDSRLRVLTTTYLGQAHHYRGDYEQAVELATDSLSALPANLDYESFGTNIAISIYDRCWLVQSLAQLGRFEEAAPYEAEALHRAEPTHHAYTVGHAYYAAATLRFLKGDWAEARALLEHGLAVWRTGNFSLSLPHPVASSAWVLAQIGEASEALTRLREGEELLERQVGRGIVNQLGGDYGSLGRACLLLGRLDEARSLGDRALKYSPSHAGSAAHALHLLGDIATHPDRFDATSAEAHHRHALALAESRGMRPLVAHCHLGLGKLCRRTDRRQGAKEHLTTATTMYRDMGMTYWLERAEAELK